MKTEPSPHRLKTTALTRMDCLALIATLTVLFLVHVSSRANTRSNGDSAQCFKNVRTLIQAWALWSQDHNDELLSVIPGGLSETPEWTGGQWMDLPVNQRAEVDPFAPERSIASSAIWPYTDRNPDTWHCPADPSMGSHPNYRDGALVRRVRSYSMNNWVGGYGYEFSASGPGWRVYQRSTDFVDPGPAETFVFLDERADSINGGEFEVSMLGFSENVSGDPYDVIIDYPSIYHENGAILSFADGHAEAHHWIDDRTIPPLHPFWELTLNVPSPNNPDVYWLQYHSTRQIVDESNATN